MPLDPRVKRFLDRLVASKPASARGLTVEARRGALAQLLAFAGGQARPTVVREQTIPGPEGALRIRAYSPPDHPEAPRERVRPGMLYFHGGGLVSGSLETHDVICRELALASGCVLVSVDYRLAPEHPFPAAIEDGLAASVWLFEHAEVFAVDRDRIAVCGDSAGATLAAVVCQQLAIGGTIRPALQFLLCPITDFCAETDSRRELAEGYFLDCATLDHDLAHYLRPGTDPADPRISPLRAPDVRGLPPACIHTAEFDPLRDEGRAYAERLRRAGVQTLYRCHAGMIHLFYGLGGLIPQAATAFALMGEDLRSMLALAYGERGSR